MVKDSRSLSNPELDYLKSYINPHFKFTNVEVLGDKQKIARFATDQVEEPLYWQPFGFLRSLIKHSWVGYMEQEHEEVQDTSNVTLAQSVETFGIELLRQSTGTVYDEDKVRLNREGIAQFLGKILSLRQTANDNELLIYNWHTCTYELSQQDQVLGKIITAVTNAVVPDSWTQGVDAHITALLSRSLKPIDGDDFDKKYAAFGTRLINMDTLKNGGEANPLKLTRMHSDVQFEPKAKCPMFRQFLNEVLPDQQDQDFLQQYTGYLLDSSFKANVFLVIKGDGRNGKSVYLNLVKKLLGKLNISSSKIESFAGDFGMAPMVNKRANLSSEGQTVDFDTAEIKAICSGDSVTINAKNQAQYTTVLKTKLIFVTNNMPTTSDTSDGFSRRLNILPFQIQIPLEKVDVDLEVKLATELPGILNWALTGLSKLRTNNFNFTISKAMREAKDDYMLFSRPVERFIKGCLIENRSATLSMKYLREKYSQWVKRESIADRGTTNPSIFSKKLREAFQSLWGQPAPIVNMHGHVNGLAGYSLREGEMLDEKQQ